MAKAAYREGDWFAVPLRDGGYAVGVVARANPQGVLLGYFFGPARMKVPTLDDVSALTASDAVLVGKFGQLGLTQGKWPILGQLPSWDRTQWPMPVFVRDEELTGRTFHVIYDDADPNRLVREDPVAPGIPEQGAKDGLMGAGFVERVLTNAVR